MRGRSRPFLPVYHRRQKSRLSPSPRLIVSAAPLDDRINARTQLEHVARGLYADPTAALAAMRNTAHAEGAETVRRHLEADFSHFGEPASAVQGAARERAQEFLQEGGLAAKMERWLQLDHAPPQPQIVADSAIERALQFPDAEALGRKPLDRGSNDYMGPGADLTPDEYAAYQQVEAYAAAKERADQRAAAEAQLHAINDHRANLDAAEGTARSALRSEAEGTYVDVDSAMERIEAAIEQDGTAATARRVRSGELFGKKDQKHIISNNKTLGVISKRDLKAEGQARERVAQRIETIGYQTGDLGKWGTFQPKDGPPVHGVKNVRAALDREAARISADAGMSAAETRKIERSGARPVHPSQDAARLHRAAQEHLDRLPPASRERVAQAVQRSGSDRMASALGHLQTVQMFARTFREGIEGPGPG